MFQEGKERDTQCKLTDDRAAYDTNHVGIKAQKDYHEGIGDNVWDHQLFYWRDADGAHRINLFGQFHRADLRGKRAA